MVSGKSQTKSMQDVLPSMLGGLGGLGGLAGLQEQLRRGGLNQADLAQMLASMGAMGGARPGAAGAEGEGEGEDDMPDLEQTNFEEAAK